MTRQIDKSIQKATAKLDILKSNIANLDKHMKKSNLHDNDEKVLKQLLANQIDEIRKKQQEHRKKLDFLPLNVMGMVTKILNKNASEYHSDGAKQAIHTEINKLITAGVWDEKPISKKQAERTHSDATFSRIFGILGIKDVESTSAKFKYRVVLQGSNVKDDGGNNVYFSDTSSAPTNMTCIRSVFAYGHLSGGECSQADAEQAFIQPLLSDDVHMYIFIPQDMWTDNMRKHAVGVHNPVFRLRRPLYGWSRSGNIWESHLAESLMNIKHQTIDGITNGKDHWKPVEGCSQTYWKIGTKGKPIILTVYVDDFIMAGPGSNNE